MRAAIYTRKSTDQSEVHESEKSVAHQRDACVALIEKSGWTQGETFTDDGISGAVFGEGRPALMRLMEIVRSKARPDVIVAYDESRLGRDMIEVSYLVKQILDAGVRLFFANGTERRLDSATDALLMNIVNFGGQFEREQAAKRTRDKMRAKALAGHSTGLPPFGYVSEPVNSHHELRIDPVQAQIVRQIFEWSASGLGISKIAHRLNQEHPSYRKWSGPTVRDLLNNSVYNGTVTYGKKRFEIRGGKRVKISLPENEWLKTPRPELRIVSGELWSAVQARLAELFKTYLRGPGGRLQGHPEAGAIASEHLLAGFCVCAECSGRLIVWSATTRANKRPRLICWRHKSRGDAACTNGRSFDLAELTEALVHQLRGEVLSLQRLVQVQRDLAADAASAPEKIAAQRVALEAERQKIELRLQRLTEAITEGGSAKTLVAAIKSAEHEQQRIEAQLKALDAAVNATADADESWAKVRELVENWDAALEGRPEAGRSVLRKLLTGPIQIEAQPGGGFSYVVEGTFGKIFSGTLGVAEPEIVRWDLRTPAQRQAAISTPADLSRELKTLAEPLNGLKKPDGVGCRA
jgi:site-specific DNA recombinase